MDGLKGKFSKITSAVSSGVETGGKAVLDKAGAAVTKTKDSLDSSKKAVVGVLDQDGNGDIDIVDVVIMACKVPGVGIHRAEFLQKELYKNHPQEVIAEAIRTTPAQAGISAEEVDKLADEVIKFERNAVSGISAALGVPGGVAMAATIPADIAQYYGYMLRAAQKLLYLYGFPDMNVEEEGIQLDSETMNALIICLGVMYGVANANNALKAMAKALASGVEKKLLQTALTKGTIYPIVKSVAKWFGVNMTKEIFAGFFKKAIPVVGGVIGGGITFFTFKPCCCRLQDVLKDTMLSNQEHQATQEEANLYRDITKGVTETEE